MLRGNLWVACATLGVVVCPAFAGTASTNLIVNGSFETPVLPAHSFYQTKAISGWWGSNGVEIQRNGNLGVGQNTPYGNQYAELEVKGPSKLLQIVPTVPGDKYTLSFDFADRPGTGVNATSVYFTGNAPVTVSLPDTGKLTFHGYSETFTATAKHTVVSFYPVQTGAAGAGNELDNVSLVVAPAAADAEPHYVPGVVPTPAPLAAGAVGLAILVVASFSRRFRSLIAR